MDLENAIRLMLNGIMPSSVVFNLNNDKNTYSVDCVFNNVKVDGEYKNITIHSDKATFPSSTELLVSKRNGENALFDIIIPDEEEKNGRMKNCE